MSLPLQRLHATTPEDLDYSFDQLDNLMDAAGIDVLIASSKHNVRYLLGGYEFIFFSAMDAIGHSRYLPLFVYVRGHSDKTVYIANKMEGGEHANHPFWVPIFKPVSWGSFDAISAAIQHLQSVGVTGNTIGIESGFLPSDAADALRSAYPDSRLVDATGTLERLRAVKTPREIEFLRKATELIGASMRATMEASRGGDSKTEIVQRLRAEETTRGLQFEYCLITLGDSHNRAVSDQTWNQGEVISLDSGGNLHGYIGDICRMGVLGTPDAELIDLLAEIEETQQAAFSMIAAGKTGADMIAHATAIKDVQPNGHCTDFFAHGMGLISHEAPFLMTNHPVAYEGTDAEKPLKSGMILSVESTMLHPTRGFIKLEDTVLVEEGHCEVFGKAERDWICSSP
ncbi:MAG: M24 family metallopeptidase [Boseongicola sp.]